MGQGRTARHLWPKLPFNVGGWSRPRASLSDPSAPRRCGERSAACRECRRDHRRHRLARSRRPARPTCGTRRLRHGCRPRLGASTGRHDLRRVVRRGCRAPGRPARHARPSTRQRIWAGLRLPDTDHLVLGSTAMGDVTADVLVATLDQLWPGGGNEVIRRRSVSRRARSTPMAALLSTNATLS